MHFHCFAIILSRRRTWPFIVKKNALYLNMLCAKFFLNWPNCSGENENAKSLQIVRLTTSDFEPSAQVSEKLLQKV